jgi:hypothetical protein
VAVPRAVTAGRAWPVKRVGSNGDQHALAGCPPGQLLRQGTMLLGEVAEIGRVYLHAAVDSCGGYAFALLHGAREAEAAVALLQHEALPFYRRIGFPLQVVLTDGGQAFCGDPLHPFESFLAEHGIEHRRALLAPMPSAEWMALFNRIALEEFFLARPQPETPGGIARLRADLAVWLHHYNHQRHHRGYREHGHTPWETVLRFVAR